MISRRWTYFARGIFGLVALLIVFVRCEGARAEVAAHGLWNGYLAQRNIIECVNFQRSPAALQLELLGSSGEGLYTERAWLPSGATRHFVLPLNIVANRYGTYFVRVENLADAREVYCFTALYRHDSQGALEYAYALPSLRAQRGAVAGIFNSMNPTGGTTPTANWLSVVNLSKRELRGRIERRSTDTTESIPFAIVAGGRSDFALGHPLGQRVGIYRIVPEDAQQPFVGLLMRYGYEGARYQFAYPLAARAGECDSGTIPISTMGPASNWLEVANVSPNPVRALLDIRNAVGELVASRAIPLGAFEQHHVHVNPLLGEFRTGSARVHCESEGGALVTQSLFYGSDQHLTWAYAAPAVESARSCATVFSANTYLGAANWIKVISAENSEPLTLALEDRDGNAVVARSVGAVPAHGALDVPLHEFSGANFTGHAHVTPSADRALSLSMIRVFATAGAIRAIMVVPGAERSCPESLTADYRNDAGAWGALLSHPELRRTQAERTQSGDATAIVADYQGAPIDLVIRSPQLGVSAPTIVVEPPGAANYSAFDAISAAVAEVRRIGAARLHFPPGEYRIEPGAAKQHVDLSDLRDIAIEGEGAVLVFTNPRRPGLAIRNSKRLQIAGLTLDWDYQNSVAVDIVGEGEYRQLEVVGGELIDPLEYDAVYTFDYLNGSWQAYPDGQRALFRDGAALSEVAPGIYTHPLLKAITPGRRGVLMRTRVGKAVTVHIRGVLTEDITLSRIRFWNTPQMSVHASGIRGLRIANCKVERSQRDPQLISGRADGFHIGGARGDILIEGNTVEGQGDDGINIRGADFEVSGVHQAEGEIVVESDPARATNGTVELDSFEAGDLLVLMDATQLPAVVLRVATAIRSTPTKVVLTFRRNTFQDLNRELAKVQAGMRGFNLSKSSSRYLIRDNLFHNNAGRGMIISAPNGVVSENQISDSRYSGMLVATFNGAFFDGPSASNVSITRNYIARTNNIGGERDKPAGAISVFVEERNARATFPLLQRLIIAENLLENVQGLAVQVAHARELKLLRNVVDRANTLPFRPPVWSDTTRPRGSLMVEHSCHVRIHGNLRDASSGELFVDSATACAIDAQSDY